MIRKKHYYLLSFILIAFFFACVSFLLEGHAYFGSDHNRNMTDLEFFASFVITCLSIFLVCLLAHRSFHVKPKWWLIIPLGVVCFTSLLALVVFPGIQIGGQNLYSLDTVGLLRYSCLTIIVFASLYVCLAILPSLTSGSTIYDLVFLATVVVAFSAVAWSYFNEIGLYEKLLAYGFPTDGYTVPKSFTNNRNIYGFILFYGMAGEAYLHIKHPHWWRWIIMAFFFFNQFFVLSKTSIVISTFFLGCFIAWSFVRSVLAHPYRNVISLGIVVAFFIGFYLGGAFNSGGLFGWFGDYFRFALQLLTARASHSFITRLVCYTQAYNAVNLTPFTALLGFGFGNWNFALYAAVNGSPAAFTPMDNAFAVDFLENGVLGFVLSITLWVYVICLIIRALQKKQTNAWVILFLTLSVLARTMTEAGDFVYLNATGVVFFCTIYLPITSDLEAHKNIVEEKSIEARYFAFPYPKLKLFSSLDAKRWFFLLTPLFVLFFGLSFGFTYKTGITTFSNVFLWINVFIGFFVFPIAYDRLKKVYSKNKLVGVFSYLLLFTYAVMAVVVSLFGFGGLFGLLIPFALLGVLIIVIFAKTGFSDFSKYKKIFFLTLTVSVALILLDNLAIAIFAGQLTVYFFVCLGVLDLIVCPVTFLFAIHSYRQWDVLEDWFLRLTIRHQLKGDLSLNHEIMPKQPYRKTIS